MPKIPDIKFTLPEGFVSVNMPKQPAPIANIEIPEQKTPIINVDIPKQEPPIVNIENKISPPRVVIEKAKKLKINRDPMGRITSVENKE